MENAMWNDAEGATVDLEYLRHGEQSLMMRLFWPSGVGSKFTTA